MLGGSSADLLTPGAVQVPTAGCFSSESRRCNSINVSLGRCRAQRPRDKAMRLAQRQLALRGSTYVWLGVFRHGRLTVVEPRT